MSATNRIRHLLESLVSGDGPALEIDTEKGVIKGVKVLGRVSKNCYQPGTESTEYSPELMRAAVPLLEGFTVSTDHNRSDLGAERKTHEVFGKLRNVRVEGDEVRADLHYLTSHPLSRQVVEDVQRRLGCFGLSINALSGRERVDRLGRKLVIESLHKVRGVDLVTRPATTRNLWESHMPNDTDVIPLTKTITFRHLVESQRKRFVKSLFKPLRQLVEDDMLGGATMDAPEADTDPDEALTSGFRAAIMAVVDKCLGGDMEAGAGFAKIKELLATHDKISDDSDDDSESEVDAENEPEEKPKAESLNDSERREFLAMKRRESARQLCESVGFTPTAMQLKALLALESDADRREFITEATGKTPLRAPRSSPRRSIAESQQTTPEPTKPSLPDAGEMLLALRAG